MGSAAGPALQEITWHRGISFQAISLTIPLPLWGYSVTHLSTRLNMLHLAPLPPNPGGNRSFKVPQFWGFGGHREQVLQPKDFCLHRSLLGKGD
jgi:hypothetical protein